MHQPLSHQVLSKLHIIIIMTMRIGICHFRNDLLVTVKYTNNLPDVPFDPKYISYPFDPNRYQLYALVVM